MDRSARHAYMRARENDVARDVFPETHEEYWAGNVSSSVCICVCSLTLAYRKSGPCQHTVSSLHLAIQVPKRQSDCVHATRILRPVAVCDRIVVSACDVL